MVPDWYKAFEFNIFKLGIGTRVFGFEFNGFENGTTVLKGYNGFENYTMVLDFSSTVLKMAQRF